MKLVTTGLIAAMLLLSGCFENNSNYHNDSHRYHQGGQKLSYEQKTERGAPKECEDCRATDFAGGPNQFTDSFCVAPANCANGNESVLWEAANNKCDSLNGNNCTGTCKGNYHCDGILNPNSSWKTSLNITAAPAGAGACPAGQVMCNVTVTIPAGKTLDCKCSCNPD